MISKLHSRTRVSGAALAVAILWAPVAFAQNEPANQTSTTAPAEDGEIVVQGFRASLNTALNIKREETAAVDSIVAEDIGKFPDSNLAESMQRIPGVTLSRGDGGEGRNIAVRGLGSQFTRVRINGMEGTSQTGSSDIYGAGNSGRSFDFNVFPTEIFSSLSVRKTTSADIEEGSLGATVDIRAPRPFDYKKDFVLSATARGVYSDVSKKVDPRASLLVSKQFADGTFGILGSVAYQKRHLREVGYSAVDIIPGNENAFDPDGNGPSPSIPYCTPVGGYTSNGVTYVSPTTTTANNGVNIGADANNCSVGNPRTSNAAAFGTIFNARRANLPNTPGSGYFQPRIPRYVNSTQNNERIGGSLTLQWQPSSDTNIWIDGLYSRFDSTRKDNYIAGISFARSITNLGQAATSVREVQLSPLGSLVYGSFDGVDVRSEGLVDHFISTFKQANFNFEQRFSDSFKMTGMIGMSKSIWDGPERLQTFIDAIDVDGFTIDYRDGNSTPKIGFGNINVANPGDFNYAPNGANGTFFGGFSTQGKPSRATTGNKTFELNGDWTVTDGFSVNFGGQYRESDFRNRGASQYFGQNATVALPAGTTLASITTQISGVDKLFGSGAPASWVAIDADKWRKTFNFPSGFGFCTTADCGTGTNRVRERVKSGYLMAKFNTEDMFPFPIRGDAGVRYVHTDQYSVGFLTSALASSPTRVTAVPNVIERDYEDFLPSMNVVFDFTPTLLGRVSLAKVMSRPELGNLIQGSPTITATTRRASTQNAFLDPIRASTFDAALEWYFKPGSLLSVAYFHKDLASYIQGDTTQVVYNQLGIPDALLAGTNTLPTEVFTVTRPTNTKGGPLSGFEVNGQFQLDFLPGFLSHFGVLANYTRVKSKIEYVVGTARYTLDLVNLSRNSASGTLYYEDSKFSIRSTANYRDRYIRGIVDPLTKGSDLQGNKPTLYVDASASYQLTDGIKLILEAQNLTDERNTLYIDSQRQDTLFETRIGRTITAGVNLQF